MIVSVAELKAHLRIQTDDEDAYLSTLIEQAQAHCEDVCMRTFPNTETDPTPEPVRLAAILLASHFYENRANEEKHVWLSVEMAVDRLLWPHRDVTQFF